MTPSPVSPSRPRTRLVLAAALTVLLVVPLGWGAAAQAKGPSSRGVENSAPQARTVTVMTRNLYLGASLVPITDAIRTGDLGAIVGAATQTWQVVQDSQPAARMAAVADEIAATKPQAIGLQEVTRWTRWSYDPATGTVSDPAVVYDFLELLLAALEDRGLGYREVPGATAENFTSDPIPVLEGAPVPTAAVQLLDRDVILVKDGVKATNARNGNFETVLGPPVFPVRIDRGWGSADLRKGLARFRFVNSHTEAFGPPAIRLGEVAELFAAQDALTAEVGPLPTVYVGDYNSPAPGGPAYQLLRSRLDDAWLSAGSGPGATCCQDDDLRNAVSDLVTRIDFVLHTAGVTARSADRVGDEPLTLPDGVRWPSDHAGVVADLVIG